MDEGRDDVLIGERDLDELSSSPSIHEDEIDFQYVYALRTFVATQQGQANAYKGDAMILLNDKNSYWWLVRLVKDSTVGFLPAEHIETPWERLARLNKHRNGELSLPGHQDIGLFDGPESSSPRNRRVGRAKEVNFMTHVNYISASEYEYSGEEADDEDDDDDFYRQDEADDVTQDHSIGTEANRVRSESSVDSHEVADGAADRGGTGPGSTPAPLLVGKQRSAKKSSGLFGLMKKRDVSIGGEDLGAALLGGKTRGEADASEDLYDDKNELSSDLPNGTDDQSGTKAKRRSLIKAKSSVEHLSAAASSSAGGSSSSSGFSKLFKRKKKKAAVDADSDASSTTSSIVSDRVSPVRHFVEPSSRPDGTVSPVHHFADSPTAVAPLQSRPAVDRAPHPPERRSNTALAQPEPIRVIPLRQRPIVSPVGHRQTDLNGSTTAAAHVEQHHLQSRAPTALPPRSDLRNTSTFAYDNQDRTRNDAAEGIPLVAAVRTGGVRNYSGASQSSIQPETGFHVKPLRPLSQPMISPDTNHAPVSGLPSQSAGGWDPASRASTGGPTHDLALEEQDNNGELPKTLLSSPEFHGDFPSPLGNQGTGHDSAATTATNTTDHHGFINDSLKQPMPLRNLNHLTVDVASSKTASEPKSIISPIKKISTSPFDESSPERSLRRLSPDSFRHSSSRAEQQHQHQPQQPQTQLNRHRAPDGQVDTTRDNLESVAASGASTDCKMRARPNGVRRTGSLESRRSAGNGSIDEKSRHRLSTPIVDPRTVGGLGAYNNVHSLSSPRSLGSHSLGSYYEVDDELAGDSLYDEYQLADDRVNRLSHSTSGRSLDLKAAIDQDRLKPVSYKLSDTDDNELKVLDERSVKWLDQTNLSAGGLGLPPDALPHTSRQQLSTDEPQRPSVNGTSPPFLDRGETPTSERVDTPVQFDKSRNGSNTAATFKAAESNTVEPLRVTASPVEPLHIIASPNRGDRARQPLTTASDRKMQNLHPDIVPIFSDTNDRIGKLCNKLDRLLSGYSDIQYGVGS